MNKPYVVYGQKGTGSVSVEATLLLLGEPYDLLQPAPTENPQAGELDAEAMARVNPMQQVPALVLPNGELMTESAAILIHSPTAIRQHTCRRRRTTRSGRPSCAGWSMWPPRSTGRSGRGTIRAGSSPRSPTKQ